MPMVGPPPSSVPNSDLGANANAPGAGTGGQVTSAPPQPPPPGAMETVQLVASIVMASRKLADSHPELIPEVREIGNQCQMIQRKLVQSLPPSQAPGPPV